MYDYSRYHAELDTLNKSYIWASCAAPFYRRFVPTVTIKLAEYEDLKLQRDTLLEERDTLLARVNEQAERIALALCTLDPWDEEDDEEEDAEYHYEDEDNGDEV